MTAPTPHPEGDTPDPAGALDGLGPAEIALALETHYPRLKGLVRSQMARLSGRNPEGFTEPPTAIANDLCMQLINQRQPFRDAEHMMAVASIRCTHIVVDYLRERGRKKRGGGNRGSPLPNDLTDDRPTPASWLLRDGVAEALSRYTEEFPRQSQTLMLRVFFGRTIPEVAALLGVSTSTVDRDMQAARAYFRAVMSDRDEPTDGREAEPD